MRRKSIESASGALRTVTVLTFLGRRVRGIVAHAARDRERRGVGLMRTESNCFFLAGFPKCGTTSIHEYLAQQETVSLPRVKEPHFFTEDYPGLRCVQTTAAYEALFGDDVRRGGLWGDCSASLIHSRVGIDRALQYAPNARFVVLVRAPWAAAASFHAELTGSFTEDIIDFQEAWDAQLVRAGGDRIPRRCREARVLQYRQIYRYEEHIARAVRLVDPKRLRLFVFEEMFADIERTYGELLAFVGCNERPCASFEQHNSRQEWSWPWLARWHRDLVTRGGAAHHALRRALNAVGIHPSHLLARTRRPAARPRLSPEFERTLREVFEPDVRAVEAHLGRPVSAWRDG